MNKAVITTLILVLASFCNIASARYIQGDPLGIVAVPLPGAPNVPFSSAPSPTMVTTSRAITASDVLRLHQLNHSYVYVNSSPLIYVDPLGLEVGTLEQRGYPTGSQYAWQKYQMCMSDELPKCPYGTVASCASICAITAPTGGGAVGCAIGCSCVVGYSCYELTKMYCTGRSGM